jgi:DNA polymerase-3 subunit epsilon
MRQIFLDTETTGLDPASGDRIIEIGCIEMENRRLTGRSLHHYLNPERPSHPDAVRVHGITDDFLVDKPLFAAIADELMDFLSGAEIIIHNAAFDIAFLNEELRRIDRAPVTEAVAMVTDTLSMAREAFPGKSNSLDALCRRLEVDNTARTLHGALLDAGLLAEVYIRLTRGQDSLVIDDTERVQEDGVKPQVVDLSAFVLPVLEPDSDELAAHEEALAQLDKDCDGKAIWRIAMA